MMVVDLGERGVLLVLQIDHSRIAGLLAAHWGNQQFAEPEPFASMVVAAQEHDSGWWDWEVKPTIAADGNLLDYTDMDYWDWDGAVRAQRARSGPADTGEPEDLAEAWLGMYRHVVERVRSADAYAAYIISKHGVGLLTQGFGLLPRLPDNSWSPRVQAFVEEQEALRAELLEELRSSSGYRDVADDEALWTNYKLMELYDQMAQFVCNRYPFNSEVQRKGPPSLLPNVPVRQGMPDVEMRITPADEQAAIVDPYPFDLDPLPVSFTGRIVPNRRYSSQIDFLRDYYKAERFPIDYVLRSSAPV